MGLRFCLREEFSLYGWDLVCANEMLLVQTRFRLCKRDSACTNKILFVFGYHRGPLTSAVRGPVKRRVRSRSTALAKGAPTNYRIER